MENKDLLIGDKDNINGKVAWDSPSNLAIIKYWGKHGVQLPRNPSISLTLTNAISKTEVIYSKRVDYDKPIDIQFLFEGRPNTKFEARISKYLESIIPYVPFIKQLSLQIKSENTFPHSSGIASSASAMSALALCITSIEHELFKTLEDINVFEKKASFLARLGSGSACRSIFDSWSLWGNIGEIEESSDEYAIGINDIVHPVFKTLHDDIFILSKAEKSVSSTAGHQLMDTNPYADIRYSTAKRKLLSLIDVLKNGDIERFGTIAEEEALSLHALMMVSNPSYILMEPNSIAMIKRIRNFRNDSGIPVFFSLDAGPNIHLLYPDNVKSQLSDFIETELLPLCVNNTVIRDQVGPGPLQTI